MYQCAEEVKGTESYWVLAQTGARESDCESAPVHDAIEGPFETRREAARAADAVRVQLGNAAVMRWVPEVPSAPSEFWVAWGEPWSSGPAGLVGPFPSATSAFEALPFYRAAHPDAHVRG